MLYSLIVVTITISYDTLIYVEVKVNVAVK